MWNIKCSFDSIMAGNMVGMFFYRGCLRGYLIEHPRGKGLGIRTRSMNKSVVGGLKNSGEGLSYIAKTTWFLGPGRTLSRFPGRCHLLSGVLRRFFRQRCVIRWVTDVVVVSRPIRKAYGPWHFFCVVVSSKVRFRHFRGPHVEIRYARRRSRSDRVAGSGGLR